MKTAAERAAEIEKAYPLQASDLDDVKKTLEELGFNNHLFGSNFYESHNGDNMVVVRCKGPLVFELSYRGLMKLFKKVEKKLPHYMPSYLGI
jgi:hypothetical protein